MVSTPPVFGPGALTYTNNDTGAVLSTLTFDPTYETMSGYVTVSVRNTSGAPIIFNASSFKTGGPFAIDYSTWDNATLAANEKCTVGVTVNPTAAGVYSGQMLNPGAAGFVLPSLELSGTALAFPAQFGNNSSCPLSLGVANNGKVGFVNNTGADVTVSRYSGYITEDWTNIQTANSAPYLFNNRAGNSTPLVVWDGVTNPGSASSVRVAVPTYSIADSEVLYLSHAYGPPDATFKSAIYLPAFDKWCAVVGTNPQGRGGLAILSTYTMYSWAGNSWTPPL